MNETCPARSLNREDIYDGFIGEFKLPLACMQCISRAQEDVTITRKITDTYEEGLATVRQYMKDFGEENVVAEEINTWGETALKVPADGPRRTALIERGFDLGTALFIQSYEPGTEISSEQIDFVCYKEAPHVIIDAHTLE